MSRIIPLSLVLVLGLGLSACGKRGPLEPPAGSQPAKVNAAEADKTGAAAGSTQPGQTKLGGKKRVPITPPKRDLFIDGILE
jgi:predicted small lipoprotein YifL